MGKGKVQTRYSNWMTASPTQKNKRSEYGHPSNGKNATVGKGTKSPVK